MKKIKKMKRSSLTAKVLKGVALTGVVFIAASSPYFGLYLIKELKKYNRRKQWKKFYASLDYLNRRGYVKFLKETDKGTQVKLTRMGEEMIRVFNIDELKLKKQENWDGKWRLIIFDVPVHKNKNRKAFTDKIKELGFIMVQKSAWAYPFECYEELAILRKFYEIERHVTYLEAIEIEDEKKWRGKFNLESRHQAVN